MQVHTKYSEKVLLHNEVQWSFDKHQIAAKEKLKQIITSTLILHVYGPNRPTKINTNTNKNVLGAVLQETYENMWSKIMVWLNWKHWAYLLAINFTNSFMKDIFLSKIIISR